MAASFIGYARISTVAGGQKLDLQLDALNLAGCSKIFQEKMSGTATSRPELDACLSYLREGDTLVVYKLDRLGRSLKHLLIIIDNLKERGIGFKSVTDGIDTTTPQGQLVYSVMACFAAYEVALLRERTFSGLQAARERGRLGGRPKAVTPEVGERIVELRGDGKNADFIAKELGIGRATVYRYLKTQKVIPG